MCENDLLNEIKKYQFYAVEQTYILITFQITKKQKMIIK